MSHRPASIRPLPLLVTAKVHRSQRSHSAQLHRTQRLKATDHRRIRQTLVQAAKATTYAGAAQLRSSNRTARSESRQDFRYGHLAKVKLLTAVSCLVLADDRARNLRLASRVYLLVAVAQFRSRHLPQRPKIRHRQQSRHTAAGQLGRRMPKLL